MPKFIFPSEKIDSSLLFHYTKSNGLLGILKEGKIWTTRIDYLNDSSELQIALNHIRDEIKKRLKKGDEKHTNKHLNQMLIDSDFIDLNMQLNICVASFTKNGNQLSQWRGYCEIGDGYSLGFDHNQLKRLPLVSSSISGEVYKYRLCRCEYNEDKQRLLIKELIDSSSHDDPLFRQKLLSLASIFKEKKFEEEQEWRLISPTLTYCDVEFHSGKSSLIPYWQFDLNVKETLRKIYIGPTPEPKLSEIGLKGLLLKHGMYDTCEVSYCDTPLRRV